MNVKEVLLKEMEHEAEGSKKILERIPEGKYDWKPHEKSMSLKQLAVHIAQIAGMPAMVINTDSVDLADGEPPKVDSTAELMALLEQGMKDSKNAVEQVDEADLGKLWAMKNNGAVIMEMPKIEFIRIMGMNHLYHHRGQISVYLRELDIPVPGLYGPSADEK